MLSLRRFWEKSASFRGVAALALGLLALFLLYPSRQLDQAKPPDNVVEIVYMGPGGPIAGAMADAVKEFERASKLAHAKDPSKPVYRVISGQNAARDQVADPTRFLVAVAGGTPPDVIRFDRYAIAEWAARGAFTPLDGFIQRDLAAQRPDTPLPSRFYKPCWDEATCGGRPYGIPVSVDNRALFYNKDLLKRAGLVDEKGEAKPPRNWDELREYARKLTERDARGRLTTIGFAPNYGNSWLYMFGWMNDAKFMSSDGRECLLNEPAVVQALDYMKLIYDDAGGYEAVQSFQAGFQGGALDPFVQGKVAMKIDGVWTVPALASYGRDVSFGVVPPPRPESKLAEGPMSWCGGWALAIPATAQNKEAAWEFIRFLSSDRSYYIQMESDRQAAEALGRVYLPPQYPVPTLNEYAFDRYVKDNPDVPRKFQVAQRLLNDLLPVSRFRPITPVGQLLWNEQINAMETALYHRMSTQEALDRSATIVQRSLDRMLNPPAGEAIRSWSFFYVIYGAIIAVVGVVVYLWDTKVGFRRRLAARLGLTRQGDAVIEGSAGGYFGRQWFGGFVCASPWLLGFLVFGGGPMLFSLFISFCHYDILNPAVFTGLENYKLMFTDDRLVPIALTNTLYMMIGVPLGMAASLGVALLLNQNVRGIAAWRTFFYLPAIVPMVAASILWIWIFNPEGGAINLLLERFGIDGPRWLQSADWSKPSLIVMGLWGAGGGMIIWLAGLKGIPQSLYEAASVDGANTWQQFRYVTLPQLTPYIFFNLIMGLIGTFQIFGQAFIMTQGGPENSTLFYVYHLFNNAFRYGRMGYASAMAWVLFAIVLVLTVIQMKFARRWVHYGEEA
jgi:multiple sugar transport system permease protein